MGLKTYKKHGEYRVISIQDDALDLPEEGKEKAWEVALETGNWPIKPTGKPVIFHMQRLGSEKVGRWQAWKDEGGNALSATVYGWHILGRLALIKVEGSDELKVQADTMDPFGIIASSKPFDTLGHETARDIQLELGRAVWHMETVTLGK